MNPGTPLVSVCIPAFNRERLVGRAIQSALAQDVPEMEVVLVDNCSTDGTWQVLNSFAGPKVRALRNERNLGLFGNFNRCLEVARGKYLKILCSDDRLLPGSLRREVELMEANGSVVVLSSRGYLVNEKERRMKIIGDHLPPGIYRGEEAIAGVLWIQACYGYNPLNLPSGVLLRRDAAARAGKFDESILATGDVDYWLRVLRFGDLALSTIPACEAMVHSAAASHHLLLSGDYLLGQFEVARRSAAILAQRGLDLTVVRHLAARAIWLAIKLMGQGHWRAARRYWSLPARNGVAWLAAWQALLMHILLRLRRLLGTCLLLDPPLPLSGSDPAATEPSHWVQAGRPTGPRGRGQ